MSASAVTGRAQVGARVRSSSPGFPFHLLSQSLALLLLSSLLSAHAQGVPSGDRDSFSPNDEALPCDQASKRTTAAVQALVAFGQPGTANPFSTAADAQTQAVWRTLAQLQAAPDFGLDTLCPVLPVDRLVDRTPGVTDVRTRETLLTAAVKTGQTAFVKAALKLEGSVKGNVYAKNAKADTPLKIAGNAFPADVLSALDPIPVPLPWSAPDPHRVAVRLWERTQEAGAFGTVAPDVDDSTAKIPAYVANLVSSQTGVSIGAASQNGAASPKIAGEVRFTGWRFLTSKDYVGRFFAYANGNVNNNKDPDKPTSPDWAGVGLGYKDLWTGNERHNTVFTSEHWFEIRTKLGDVENLLARHRANYVVSNTEASYFFHPIPRSFYGETDSGKAKVSGSSAYVALTAGAQLQKRQSGVAVPDERPAYTFERADFYAYPLWLVNVLFKAADNSSDEKDEGCLREFVGLLRGECSTVVLHIDRQVVNNKLGALNEYSLSWGFRKGLSLVFTRSVGVQDPLSAFGVKLPKSAQSQLSLKITPSTGGSN